MSVKFDVNTFLNYYKDESNYYIDTDEDIITNYFVYSKKRNGYVLRNNVLSRNYIIINDKKLYLTHYKDQFDIEHILFTTPIEINGEFWDTHYHFGIEMNYKTKRINTKSRKITGKTIRSSSSSSSGKTSKLRRSSNKGIIPVIFFHKTIQDPTKHKKKSVNCYFKHNINLERFDVSEFNCESDNKKRMKNYFSIGSDDLVFIEEIIRRPFYGIQAGGGGYTRRQKKYFNNNSKTRRKK